MKTIYPAKLQPGDEIRVIAPSRSMALIGEEGKKGSLEVLEKLGYKITFGKHVSEKNEELSSSVKSRISDLHDAYKDKNVKAILTVIGGFNCNQMLHHIDYELIKKNPKIFCGFSDITALSNAIYAKTGLVGYSGMHFASFRMKYGNEYSIKSFTQCLTTNKPYEVKSSKEWSDDEWWMNQEKRTFIPNKGAWVLQKGKAEGTIIGGNLCTINLLQGTEYMPSLKDVILFVEDDEMEKENTVLTFDCDLQSLLQQKGLTIKGLAIGRFQKASEMTREKLERIVSTKSQLKGIPIIANLDFGHSTPMITYPIGGTARINGSKLEIVKH